MTQESILVIHGWPCKLSRAESGDSKVGQTVLARLIESQIWHQLASSVGDRFTKGSMASAHLDDRHFSFSIYTSGVFYADYPSVGA